MDFNSSRMKRLAKWIIGVAAVCILIFICVNKIDAVARGVSWVFDLFGPILLGLAFALILNVPMSFFERILWPRAKNKVWKKTRRPVAFILSLLIIIGIITGIICLVVPELTKAVNVVIDGAVALIKEISDLDKDSKVYVFFDDIIKDIDMNNIISKAEEWVTNEGPGIMNSAVNTVTALFDGIIDFFIAFVLAIYILFTKNTLKAQFSRLIRAWLPKASGEWIIHASSVASGVFRSFVSGQTIEAFIIGMLCMIGMFILRIPYAPMVGTLVGITALVPIVGAFAGAGVGAFMILTVDPLKALVFLIFLLVLQQIEGNVIYPKVMGSKVNLPALWILSVVTVGGGIGGAVGMLLAVPVASTAYVLLREATEAKEEKKKAAEQPEEESEAVDTE